MKYVREMLLGFRRKGVCLTRVLLVAAWKMDSWTGFWRKSCAMRLETNILAMIVPACALFNAGVGMG